MAECAVMPGLSLVEEFAAAAERAPAMPVLNALTADAMRELGFDYFAVVHHVPYGKPLAGRVGLHCYPEEWVAKVRDMGRPPDTVLRAAAAGFASVRALHALTSVPRVERTRPV